VRRLALAVLGVALLREPVRSASPERETPTPAAVRTAPEFSRVDLDGREIRLSSYRGKVVLLNFWATWCAPCIAEIPRFAQWQRDYGERGLQVLGVSMDDEEAAVRAIYRRLRMTYPVVMGDERLGELYGGVFGLPRTLLLDRMGRIRFEHEGEIKLVVLEREIQELLPPRP
jgi:cytochrome c biogenesis protein CcmG, thiol:disulfide interchange protein DsbE